MKKRGMLALLLALALAASMAVLTACGGGQAQSQSKESLSVSAEPQEEAVPLKTEPFYVLVVGNDTREGTVNLTGQYANGLGRSDTTMLIRVDPTKYTFDLITVPRDTQATYDGETVKLNETFEKGGIEGLQKEIKSLTGVTPDYYMVTTFVGFEDIIDGMGGLKINVPIDESMADIVTNEQIDFSAGDQQLNGKEALVYARDRHSYDYTGNGEAYRQTNDRYIMQTIIESILAMGPEKAGPLAKTLFAHLDTNFQERELVAYVEDFAKNAKLVKFTSSCSGPYDGDIDPDTGKWLAYRDEETWAKLIKAVEAGKDTEEVLPAPVVDHSIVEGSAENTDANAASNGEEGPGAE